MQTPLGSIHSAIVSRLTWLLAAAVLCGCGTLGTKPPRATNLTGDWHLNESLSEDPLAQSREERQSRGGGMHRGGGLHGGGMHGGGMGGGNWSGRGGMPRQRGQGANGDFLARPNEIGIEQTARELDLNADGSATQFVYGEKVTASVQGGTAERVSGWKDGEFVVKYAVTDGPTATRGYKLADSGRQLVVTTQVEGGRARKLEYRTVYDRKAKDS
jgi:hypothetical protein